MGLTGFAHWWNQFATSELENLSQQFNPLQQRQEHVVTVYRIQ